MSRSAQNGDPQLPSGKLMGDGATTTFTPLNWKESQAVALAWLRDLFAVRGKPVG